MIQIDPKGLELRKLHGLVIGTVAPRPIAWVSTRSKEGQDNLAPFSYFNAFSSQPPVIAFSPSKRGRDGSFKDTYLNLMQTRECVVHIVTSELQEQMNLTSTEFDPGTDEFVKAGLTKQDALRVQAKRVQESPIHMECKLRQMISLGDQPASGNLAICDIVMFHIREDLYQDGRVQIEDVHHVGRNGGSFYTRCNIDSMFELPAPKTDIGIGMEQLPAWLFDLGLSKNELAQLALIQELPAGAKAASFSIKELDDVKALLARRKTSDAWSVLLSS